MTADIISLALTFIGLMGGVSLMMPKADTYKSRRVRRQRHSNRAR